MSDLTGLTIVVTRPQAQAEAWADTLRGCGANVHVVPLMDIVPVQEEAQIRAIKNCILDLDLYQKAIFVSQNAVEQGFEWIENYWPQLPIRVDFFAVGQTTAKQLMARGATVTDLAQTQDGDMTSEALLQSAALQSVAGEKIIIFRGLGGRSHLGDTLTERGAQVNYCELYERKMPQGSDLQLAELLSRYQQSDLGWVITVHSGESLQNLASLLQGQFAAMKENLQLLVPSQRVAEQAKAMGFARVFTAQNATDASMLQGLLNIKCNLTKV